MQHRPADARFCARQGRVAGTIWQIVAMLTSELWSNWRLKKVWVALKCSDLTRLLTWLPGKAFAQRTTDTNCLSPSSLRLVSRDVRVSGRLWSCPAFTTAGSIFCKMLSKEWKEDRDGGMDTTKAWEAAGDTHTEYNIIYLLGKIKVISNRTSLSWCNRSSYNDY